MLLFQHLNNLFAQEGQYCHVEPSPTGQGTGQCPAEGTEVRKRTVLGKQQLFTRCKFKEEFIKLKQVP